MSASKNKYSTVSDENLVQIFSLTKNETVFNEIYFRYFSTLTKFAVWLTQDKEGAKDIAQEALYKFWKNPESFDTNRNLKVWLYSNVKNAIRNEIRARVNRENMETKFTNGLEYERTAEVDLKKLSKISNAINHLSENHREVFILKYSNNLTIKEISEVINVSQGTVKSRLFYALQQLRNQVIDHSKNRI